MASVADPLASKKKSRLSVRVAKRLTTRRHISSSSSGHHRASSGAAGGRALHHSAAHDFPSTSERRYCPNGPGCVSEDPEHFVRFSHRPPAQGSPGAATQGEADVAPENAALHSSGGAQSTWLVNPDAGISVRVASPAPAAPQDAGNHRTKDARAGDAPFPGVRHHPSPSLTGLNGSDASLEPSKWNPVWAVDDDVDHCQSCGERFRKLLRKHHCRRCGAIICRHCSPDRLGDRRVCKRCKVEHEQLVFHRAVGHPKRAKSGPVSHRHNALEAPDVAALANSQPPPSSSMAPTHAGDASSTRPRGGSRSTGTLTSSSTSTNNALSPALHSGGKGPQRRRPDEEHTSSRCNSAVDVSSSDAMERVDGRGPESSPHLASSSSSSRALVNGVGGVDGPQGLLSLLPPSVRAIALCYAGVASVCAVQAVCRGWREAAQSPAVWGPLYAQHWGIAAPTRGQAETLLFGHMMKKETRQHSPTSSPQNVDAARPNTSTSLSPSSAYQSALREGFLCRRSLLSLTKDLLLVCSVCGQQVSLGRVAALESLKCNPTLSDDDGEDELGDVVESTDDDDDADDSKTKKRGKGKRRKREKKNRREKKRRDKKRKEKKRKKGRDRSSTSSKRMEHAAEGEEHAHSRYTAEEREALSGLRALIERQKAAGAFDGGHDLSVQSDATLVKYLRARRLTPEKALELMVAGVAYRAEHGLEAIRVSQVFKEIQGIGGDGKGMVFTDPHARDCDGRMVFVVFTEHYDKKHTSGMDIVRACYYLIEAAFEEDVSGSVERVGFTLIVDCKNSKYSNLDMRMPGQVIGGVVGKFPARIGHVALINTPWWFSAVWRLLTSLLPKHLVEKFHIVGKLEELHQWVPPESLLPEHGGTASYDFRRWVRRRFRKDGEDYVPFMGTLDDLPESEEELPDVEEESPDTLGEELDEDGGDDESLNTIDTDDGDHSTNISDEPINDGASEENSTLGDVEPADGVAVDEEKMLERLAEEEAHIPITSSVLNAICKDPTCGADVLRFALQHSRRPPKDSLVHCALDHGKWASALVAMRHGASWCTIDGQRRAMPIPHNHRESEGENASFLMVLDELRRRSPSSSPRGAHIDGSAHVLRDAAEPTPSTSSTPSSSSQSGGDKGPATTGSATSTSSVVVGHTRGGSPSLRSQRDALTTVHQGGRPLHSGTLALVSVIFTLSLLLGWPVMGLLVPVAMLVWNVTRPKNSS